MCSRRIRQVRKSKGITQEVLALRVGLSQAEISRKENGRTALNIDDLNLFATALGVPATELLDDSQTKAVGK